jgi:hypothetical protein
MANEQASMNAQLREECDQARSNSASLIAARDGLVADVSRLQVELQQIKTQAGEQTQAVPFFISTRSKLLFVILLLLLRLHDSGRGHQCFASTNRGLPRQV